jgi:tetratricopeptide (TPR) repeat protein
MLAVVPQWLRLLGWPAHLSAEYSPREIEIPSGPGPEIALGVAILLASVVAFLALGRGRNATPTERSAARLGLAWLGITLLPVSNLFSVMLVAERTLLLPSVGAVLVAGALASWAIRSTPQWGVGLRARFGLATVVAALVVAGTIRSRDRQGVWHDNATLFAQTAEDAPRSYRAQFFYGQLLFEQGRRAEGERRLRLAIALNPTPSDVSPLNYLATQYRDAGLCHQALPLYERALTNDDARPDVRYGMAACLLQTGRVREARQHAEEGARRGDLKALFLEIIARSDSVATSGG